MVFYGCKLYAGQLKSGEHYETVSPVYTIWLITGIFQHAHECPRLGSRHETPFRQELIGRYVASSSITAPRQPCQ